jgi:hypothetical protein
MSRSLPLAIVLASLAIALARAASGYDFSVDPTSPEVAQFRYGSSDVVDQTGGGPIVFASNLGIGSDELDGFSYGKDLLRPANLPNFFVSMQFSVSRATQGAGGVVTTQRNLNGAAGDKLAMLILRNGRTVGPFLASDAPNHKLTPGAGSAAGQSELDGLSFPSGSKPSIYYTVARGGVRAPSDVVFVADWPQATPPALFATAAQLGLQATDNVDALAIKDGGTIGTLDAADVVYVSLDAASPTRIARGGQDDILQVWPAPIAVAIAFNKLDIQATTGEEIDAITGYDPGPALLALLVAPGGGGALPMGDLVRSGNVNAYFGTLANQGWWTEIRPGLDFDPLQIVPQSAGQSFISPWHALASRPWDRGTGYGSASGESLRYYGWNVLGLTETTVVSQGDAIPGGGGSIQAFNRCGLSSVGPWRCFSSGVYNASFQLSWASWCDDSLGAWAHSVTWARPGDVVSGKTIQSLGTMDGATDPANTQVANFYGNATTSTGEVVVLHRAATSTTSGPSWGALNVVVDSSTPVPGSSGALNYVGRISTNSAVFHGRTTSGQDGIYKYANGALTRIADKTTPVPGGTGFFTGFLDDVSNDEGAVTFLGTSSAGTGLYTTLNGRLQKVAQANDVIEGRTVSGLRLERDAAAANMVAFGVRFNDGFDANIVKELPEPFDTSDVTQRAIHVDVELDASPAILGPDPRALLIGDLGTLRLRGIWTSNGTLGTVTIPGSELERALALQFGMAGGGGIGEWVTTVDVATGMVLSSIARGTLTTGPFAFEADTNGGPWTSPLIAGGIAGTQAGFETNAGGQALFCSNAFSQIAGSACAAGAFGFPAAQHYDSTSGFVHMTGPLTLGTSVLWGFLGDQRWVEAPAGACAGDTDLDSDGVCDLVDNCKFEPNASQTDVGGIGATAPPNGRGDACECGDVSGNGRVTTADATLVTRANLVPPTARLLAPDKCNVGGSAACSTADATILTRASLVPPTASVQNVCAAAAP